MAEQFIETIIIRQDNRPEVDEPTFDDVDVDGVFEFEGELVLAQINKTIQNAVHNRHDYVFKIKSISKIKKEE